MQVIITPATRLSYMYMNERTNLLLHGGAEQLDAVHVDHALEPLLAAILLLLALAAALLADADAEAEEDEASHHRDRDRHCGRDYNKQQLGITGTTVHLRLHVHNGAHLCSSI